MIYSVPTNFNGLIIILFSLLTVSILPSDSTSNSSSSSSSTSSTPSSISKSSTSSTSSTSLNSTSTSSTTPSSLSSNDYSHSTDSDMYGPTESSTRYKEEKWGTEHPSDKQSHTSTVYIAESAAEGMCWDEIRTIGFVTCHPDNEHCCETFGRWC